MGLLASLSRPGGNITGVANLNLEVGPKKLQLLHEPIATLSFMVAPQQRCHYATLRHFCAFLQART
jgi:hypothetical protein